VLRAATESPDGRGRGHWDALGAVTGRLTCVKPNLLGISKRAEVRRLFKARPGHVIVSIDASNMELRVAADVLGDEALLAVFDDPEADVHAAAAGKVLGKPPHAVTSPERKNAKPIVFGTVLGQKPPGLVTYAANIFNLTLTLEEATAWQEAFIGAFPRLGEWQAAVRKSPGLFATTASGRYRRFPDREHDINARLAYQIQGTAADAMKSALVCIAPLLSSFGAELVLAPHDEFVFECPEATASEMTMAMLQAIVRGFRRFLPRVGLAFEYETGPTWT
jgi:DNA polymerase-1